MELLSHLKSDINFTSKGEEKKKEVQRGSKWGFSQLFKSEESWGKASIHFVIFDVQMLHKAKLFVYR